MPNIFLRSIFLRRIFLHFQFFYPLLGYMTKTLNQIIFFSSTKIRIFFSTTLGIRIFFFRKIPYLPPRKLNGRSLTKSVWMPLCKLSASSCAKVRSCVSQLFFAQNPRWQSTSMFCLSRSLRMLDPTIFSRILQHIHVSDTGL